MWSAEERWEMVSAGNDCVAADREQHVLSGIMCLLSASPFPLISRTSSFWLVEAVSQVLTSSPFLSTVTRSVSAMISSSLWVT